MTYITCIDLNDLITIPHCWSNSCYLFLGLKGHIVSDKRALLENQSVNQLLKLCSMKMNAGVFHIAQRYSPNMHNMSFFKSVNSQRRFSASWAFSMSELLVAMSAKMVVWQRKVDKS